MHKYSFAMFCVVVASLYCSESRLTTAIGQDQQQTGRMPVYMIPIYDFRGPTIDVGQFSEELARADEKSILAVVVPMRKKWTSLSVEQMYVAAIRLFDLGHKDEAVYWFYSAQYRSRVFLRTLETLETDFGENPDEETIRGMGSAELQVASFSVIGVFINEYAFRDPERLGTTIQKVKNEYKSLPDMKMLYPFLKHVPDEKWNTAHREIDEALVELQDLVGSLKGLKGDDVKTALEEKTPLHKAFEDGNKKLFTRLLKEGADPNFRPRLTSCMLHQTAEHQDSFWLRTALKYGGDPNLLDTGHPYAPGFTLLLNALVARQHANVVLLIDAGANVNETYRGTSPLYKAQQRRQWRSMIALLDAGVDPRLPAIQPAYDDKVDRDHLEHYNNLDAGDYRVHERNRKEYGWDYTLDEEKEMYFKVRARLVKDGVLKPDKVEPSPAKDAP